MNETIRTLRAELDAATTYQSRLAAAVALAGEYMAGGMSFIDATEAAWGDTDEWVGLHEIQAGAAAA